MNFTTYPDFTEDQKRYFLLKTYQQNAFPMREILLRTTINNIRHIEDVKTLSSNLSEKEKTNVKSMFQLDAISGIMMYIEDLVVILESSRQNIAYYKLLDTSSDDKDLGDVIHDFFLKLNNHSDETFRKFLGYTDPLKLDMNKEERNLVDKVIQENTMFAKKTLNQIKQFADISHPVFRRFKHAGAPFVLGNTKPNGFLSKFDSVTMVPIGKNPLSDAIPIPLSECVLMGYENIITKIKTLLDELLLSHIACIIRKVDGVPPTLKCGRGNFSTSEVNLYNKIVADFDIKHPEYAADFTPLFLQTHIEREEIKWYLDLPNCYASPSDTK